MSSVFGPAAGHPGRRLGAGLARAAHAPAPAHAVRARAQRIQPSAEVGAPGLDGETRLRCTVLTRFEDFARLEAAWNELYLAARGRTANLHFGFIAAAWETVCQPRGDTFRCLLIHDGAQLMGAWPLAIRPRDGGTAAYLPGTGPKEEYGDPLIRAGGGELATARAFLAPLRTLADSCWLFNLRAGGPMDRAAREARAIYIHRGTARSPILAAPRAVARDAWLAGKSKSFRQGLSYDRKRMERLGPVEFGYVEAAPAREALIDWIFATKREALGRDGRTWSWVFGEGPVSLLKRAAAACADVRVCALTVGGRTAAAAIVLKAPETLEYFVTAYDPAYRSYSPGNLLVDELVRECFADGLAFDFRISPAAYKDRWIDGHRPYNTYALGNTLRGALPTLQHSARRADARFRVAVKARLRRLAARLSAR